MARNYAFVRWRDCCDWLCRPWVCVWGRGRKGRMPTPGSSKPYLYLCRSRDQCVHGGWLREDLQSQHVCAALRWMRHPGRRGGESKSRQRAWVFQGKAMGPHVSSDEFPFLYFSSERWWQCSALAIQKVDRIFLGVPCFEPFGPFRNSLLKTPYLWTDKNYTERERKKERETRDWATVNPKPWMLVDLDNMDPTGKIL